MKEKKYDMVTIVGVACSVIALILIMMFRPGMPKELPATPAESAAAPSSVETGTQAVPVQQPSGAVSENAKTDTAAPNVTPQAAAIPVAGMSDIASPRNKPGKTITLSKADELSAEFDAQGGCIGVTLSGYNVYMQKKGTAPSALVSLGNYDYPFLALTSPSFSQAFDAPKANDADIAKGVFSVERVSKDGKLKIKEVWSLSADNSYQIDYNIVFENLSDAPVLLDGYRIEAGAMPESVSPDRKAKRGESSGGLSLGRRNDKSKDLSIKDLTKLDQDDRAELAKTPASWVAVHSKYFLMGLWMKDAAFPGVECASVPSAHVEGAETKPDGRYHARVLMPQAIVEKGATLTWAVTAYAGPKMFERLSSYDSGLDSIMEMDRFFLWRPGWMRFISRCLLKMLVLISGIFPKCVGYGLAVIILTILVKIVFWPLSHKSTVSMRRMQALKPQLDEIKAKYNDDKATMYRKQQELFKENNVSQLGGCLPMLLQIPVFFALFNTFRNAIELRHASFLWAYDLSMPDTLSFSPEIVPIRPLALLMGLTMFFQQKMTPNPDPQQAKMMNFMTIFFIVLFYNMPAALTLYLSVSYILGIVQTLVTNKLMPMPKVVTSGTAPVKK